MHFLYSEFFVNALSWQIFMQIQVVSTELRCSSSFA